MKSFKRLASCFLVLLLLFCTACGGPPSESAPSTTTSDTGVSLTTSTVDRGDTNSTEDIASSTSTTNGTADDTTATSSSLGEPSVATKTTETTTTGSSSTTSRDTTSSRVSTTTKATTTTKPAWHSGAVGSVAPKDDPVLKNLDFIVTVPAGREVRVLQLTDTQIVEWQLAEARCFTYIRKAVETVKPDFIFITGDLVYGKYDDDGKALRSLIDLMDSFQIPWTGVWGNHDNESKMGAIWQCQQMENSKYCLFNSNDNVTGNSNFNIGIVQDGELQRVFYMLDSNYCGGAYKPTENGVSQLTKGFTKEQVIWMQMKMERVQKALGGKVVNSSVCHHVPTMEFVNANNQYLQQKEAFTLHLDLKANIGDFGSIRETGGIKTPFSVADVKGLTYLELLKKYNVDSVFCGHSHRCNTSVMWEGIRWTFGLKTGTFDRFNHNELGGTQITFNKTALSVRHVYYDDAHDTYMNTLEQTGPFA